MIHTQVKSHKKRQRKHLQQLGETAIISLLLSVTLGAEPPRWCLGDHTSVEKLATDVVNSEAIAIDHSPAEERQPNWACYVYEIILPNETSEN